MTTPTNPTLEAVRAEDYDTELQVACEACGTLMLKDGQAPPLYDHATGYHYCFAHESLTGSTGPFRKVEGG